MWGESYGQYFEHERRYEQLNFQNLGCETKKISGVILIPSSILIFNLYIIITKVYYKTAFLCVL